MESCRECEAILLEYRRAYADFWLNASPETRDAYQTVANLIGGTEEDVVRLEGLVPPFRTASAEQLSMEHRREGGRYQGTSDSEQVREVMGRKIKHQMATGHFVKFAIAGNWETKSTPTSDHIPQQNALSEPGFLGFPMTCDEKTRLLRQYDNATLVFSNAVQELRRKIGTSPKEEYERLERISSEARFKSEQARLALEQHIATHRC
jgi:hypothetical protein